MAHRSKTAAFPSRGSFSCSCRLRQWYPLTEAHKLLHPMPSCPAGTGAISGDLDQSGDSTTHQFTNHDFDDEGNMYYVVGDDYGNWMDNQYQFREWREAFTF